MFTRRPPRTTHFNGTTFDLLGPTYLRDRRALCIFAQRGRSTFTQDVNGVTHFRAARFVGTRQPGRALALVHVRRPGTVRRGARVFGTHHRRGLFGAHRAQARDGHRPARQSTFHLRVRVRGVGPFAHGDADVFENGFAGQRHHDDGQKQPQQRKQYQGAQYPISF